MAYPIPSQDGGLAVGQRLMNFVWYRNVAQGRDLDDLMTDRHGSPPRCPCTLVRCRIAADEMRTAATELPYL